MTANVILDDANILQIKAIEDMDTLKRLTNSIKSEFAYFYNREKENEIQNEDNIENNSIVKMLLMAIKTYSNSFEKSCVALNCSDIEQIKTNLTYYASRHKSYTKIVDEIIDDLSKFQKRLRINHYTKIGALKIEKEKLEKEVVLKDFEKNKLIMDRLSKIMWPYDSKTAEYESMISNLKVRIQRYKQSILEQQTLEPAAGEKDILLYRMHIQEKFA